MTGQSSLPHIYITASALQGNNEKGVTEGILCGTASLCLVPSEKKKKNLLR
jgi:hypothetical protein